MPSYPQNQYSRYHGYPTPPEEYLRGYAKDPMSGISYQNNFPIRLRQDERHHDFQDPFMRHAQHRMSTRVSPPTQMYHGAPYMPAIGTGAQRAPNGYYDGSVVLPPIRNFNPPAVLEPQPQQAQPRPEPKEERPVGGVSAKLDYDMDIMTDFVASTAHAMYGFLTSFLCFDDIDIFGSIMPSRQAPSNFRKWVHQVLSATRLPSSTILIAFEYLSVNMRYAQSRGTCDYGETDLFHMLTTSLILGSKFLDDNTFINRSWAEVSGIDVNTLNKLELQWLGDMGFRLHRDPHSPGGFQSFKASWHQFEATRRNQSIKKSYERSIAFKAEPTPNFVPSYSRYAPIGSSQSTSPPSAPHTGPTTPEYYAPQSGWPSIEAYGLSRLPPPAYSHLPAPSSASVVSSSTSFSFPAPAPAPMYANSHGSECFCHACARQYMMLPHFGSTQLMVS
jgi:hypothetical protein